MRRIEKYQNDNDLVVIRIETDRSIFDDVEITGIESKNGVGWVEFWGLNYRGYREWHIEIDRIERLAIE